MLMSKKDAESAVAFLTEDDPEWTYKVEERGNYCVIVIYDDDGECLGEL